MPTASSVLLTYVLLEILLIPKAPNQRPFYFLLGVSSSFSLDLILVLLIALGGISYLSYIDFICNLTHNSVHRALITLIYLFFKFYVSHVHGLCQQNCLCLSHGRWGMNPDRHTLQVINYCTTKIDSYPSTCLRLFFCGQVLLSCRGKPWPTSVSRPLGSKACATKSNLQRSSSWNQKHDSLWRPTCLCLLFLTFLFSAVGPSEIGPSCRFGPGDI